MVEITVLVVSPTVMVTGWATAPAGNANVIVVPAVSVMVPPEGGMTIETGVGLGVAVAVAVLVGVLVGVWVCVAVAVGVLVAVCVAVGVAVGVPVAVLVGV
ncbi:MAG: hypothetical protein HYR71_08455 [Chloroflexi bacterium]|nr:hypothetical protein [Chloroflexota bacterium]